MAAKKIGEMLVENRIITNSQLEEGLEVQKEKGGMLGIIFVELGYLKPDQLSKLLATQSD